MIEKPLSRSRLISDRVLTFYIKLKTFIVIQIKNIDLEHFVMLCNAHRNANGLHFANNDFWPRSVCMA